MASVTYGQPVKIVAKPVQPKKSTRKLPQLSREKRAEIAQTRAVKNTAIEEEIHGWYEESVKFAEELHRRFPSKSTDFYLNSMFSGALKLRGSRQPNSYNAWLHHLAQNGEGGNAVQLGKKSLTEYEQLTHAEKQELVQSLQEERDSRLWGLRLNSRSRTQDVNHVCNTIEDSLMKLQARAGIEGFYCVVRSNSDYAMRPRFWFTSDRLSDYLQGAIRNFNPERIGVLSEAFAIAGTDYFSQLKSSKQKVAWLKGEIRDLVQEGLEEATGEKNVKMSYKNFTRDIELVHGITMKGWEHPQWRPPSKLNSDISALRALRDDLLSGACGFVALTPAQLATVRSKYEAKMAAGERPARKPRKDIGVPRRKSGKAASKRPRVEDSEGSDDESTSNDESSDED